MHICLLHIGTVYNHRYFTRRHGCPHGGYEQSINTLYAIIYKTRAAMMPTLSSLATPRVSESRHDAKLLWLTAVQVVVMITCNATSWYHDDFSVHDCFLYMLVVCCTYFCENDIVSHEFILFILYFVTFCRVAWLSLGQYHDCPSGC